MKALEIITVVPGTLYFASEVEVLINNLRKFGHSDKLSVLVESDTAYNWKSYWIKFYAKYPEVKFFFYSTGEVRNLKTLYPPVIRPNILKQHFTAYPSLKDKAIFYIDSDICFTKQFDFTPYLEDEINYCSHTNYISAEYFDSKDKDVISYKIKQYADIDVLNDCCKIVGITRKVAEDNQENTGGCQYILKNITSNFWKKIEQDCITLRIHLQSVNNLYFTSEKSGFQSWCSDMFALLWNLWLNKTETKCPRKLDFCWATQKIEEWDKHSIYHNAGVVSKYMILDDEQVKMYNKSEIVFRENILTPFDVMKQDHDGVHTGYCDYNYLSEILEITNPVCITQGYKY